jgi:hypothetical protein
VSQTVKNALAEVEALAAELAGLEALAERHQKAADEAARAHRAGKADPSALKDATAAAAAITYAREQVAADLEAARAHVAELESASEDEAILARVAAGTLAYRDAEREHVDLLMATEHAIARAITRSNELKRAASAAKTAASGAAHQLAAKHSIPLADALARAVNGADVAPLRGGDNDYVTAWPAGRRQTYKLISQVGARTLGVRPE